MTGAPIVIELLLSLVLGLQLAPQPLDEVTDLEEIVVTGVPLTGLLSVTVDGARDPQTLVTTEPDLRCGHRAFRWDAYRHPRLCWLRREQGSVIVLAATSSGRPGVDWRVDWDGCSRVISVDRCEVTIGSANSVRATFRAGAGPEDPIG